MYTGCVLRPNVALGMEPLLQSKLIYKIDLGLLQVLAGSVAQRVKHANYYLLLIWTFLLQDFRHLHKFVIEGPHSLAQLHLYHGMQQWAGHLEVTRL